MNEVEWVAGNDSTRMLKFAQSKQRRRTERLFSCACCRRLWSLLPRESQIGVEVAERFADGRASNAELDDAHAKANDAVLALPNIWSYEVVRLRYATSAAADCSVITSMTTTGAAAVATKVAHAVSLDAAVRAPEGEFSETRERARVIEQQHQANLVREIFGNPYRKVTFLPDWHTETAHQLAWQMYETGDFSAMPILADALQDAGCDNEGILEHCRNTSHAHIRGCWVIDLVLGIAGFPVRS